MGSSFFRSPPGACRLHHSCFLVCSCGQCCASGSDSGVRVAPDYSWCVAVYHGTVLESGPQRKTHNGRRGCQAAEVCLPLPVLTSLLAGVTHQPCGTWLQVCQRTASTAAVVAPCGHRVSPPAQVGATVAQSAVWHTTKHRGAGDVRQKQSSISVSCAAWLQSLAHRQPPAPRAREGKELRSEILCCAQGVRQVATSRCRRPR